MTGSIKKKRLTYHEAKFIEGKAKGLNNKDAAIFGGYAPLTADVAGSRLMKKAKILEALDKVGLTDVVLASVIKQNIEAGTGIKATADTALKGVELALKLRGHLQNEQKTGDLSQTNIYINELQTMSDEELTKKVEELQRLL